MTPNKENIQKWVNALRSGEYWQGYGVLRTPVTQVVQTYKYCCLGVACDISGVGEWYGDFYGVQSKDARNIQLPKVVCVWLGIENPDVPLKTVSNAIVANDREGWSFYRIADAIEETYLKGA